MRHSTVLSIGLLSALVAWMLSGATASVPETPESPLGPLKSPQQMKVTILDVKAREITREIVIQGELEPLRQVALLVDESVLKATGRVSQQSAGGLRLRQRIQVRLLDGREAVGQLTYISRVGDAETHSFRVEAEVPNTDHRLNAGTSAELRIAVGTEPAHFLSPAVLSLGDKGEVGMKSVDDQGVVGFFPIQLDRSEFDGVWVSGLLDTVSIITQGQGFVNRGESVIPVPAARG
ncbi:MAG: HlyD family efflux transporter periplasmic adaptor subunit [Gammaproteobacteria bacterium]|nr:HlyD family efflux transporter periplasmic adaptor subunit [Gammaproteobacteria bacterium]